MITLRFKISCLVLILVQTTSYTQGPWEKTTVPTNQFLKSVCFVDSLYGWAAGDSGTIIHTSDGGDTWIIQDSQTQNDIVSIFFLNRNLGWASSLNYTTPPFGTVLLKTTNGGNSWISEPYPEENIFINCILFLDSLNGWMGGNPHALLKTTNGGLNWTKAETDTTIFSFFPVLKIYFYNEQYGYACGGMFDIAGVIWRTSNGGQKWYTIDPSDAPADEVRGLHLFDSMNVLGAGGDPDYGYGVGMIRTSDGGVNWDYEELGIQGNAYDLDFRNSNEVWAPLGPRAKFICSFDAGSTWMQIPTPDSTLIYDMTFPDSLHGFAVGAKGAVLRFNTEIIPSVEYGSSSSSYKVNVYQNQPNPFERTTAIRYKLSAFSRVVLKVFDVFGIEIITLLDSEMPPGSYEVPFDASGLHGGIYFYRLTASLPGAGGTFSETRKMVLLK